MATPFINLQQPSDLLHRYDKTKPHTEQSSTIPKTFLDAMSVREAVYVQEQNIPLENEFDSDDPRSCHWVIYASISKPPSSSSPPPPLPSQTSSSSSTSQNPQQPQEPPRQSTNVSLPIGTIRLVPFPHPPHPAKGSVYVDGVLVTDPSSSSSPPPPTSSSSAADTAAAGAAAAAAVAGPHSSSSSSVVPPSSSSGGGDGLLSLSFTSPDRPTTFHDGHEPYVKLGRLAVLPAYRRMGIAGQLIHASIGWMRQNHAVFDPLPSTVGFEKLGITESSSGSNKRHNNNNNTNEIHHHKPTNVSTETTTTQPQQQPPKWRGLICVHAQDDAISTWSKYGFEVDDEMGTWLEEGIPHVGMWKRVKVGEGPELLV